MITSLRLVNFKNFADETLRVGPVTVIVGANASGKSNVRDAFRLLHGIGRGYTLAEIMGGKLGTGGERVWSPIRGAPREIVRLESSADLSVGYPMRHTIVQGGDFDPRAGLALEVAVNVPEHVRYAISVHPDNARPDFFRVGVEQLQRSRDSRSFQNPGVTPVLTQSKKWNEPYRACAENVAGVLASMRFFDPTPRFMREPAFPGQSFGDSGENLAAALHEICTDPQRMETFAEWIGELTPMDVRGLEFPSDPSGRLHLVIRDANDREVSAYAASDGTLRFLAMLAALLGDTRTGLYFFEEIDNGIHPSRLWLLLELIEQRTAKGDMQIITTTHSPDLVSMVSDSTFENMSLTCCPRDGGDAVIRRLADLPNARELRKSQGLRRLHASGWMEDAVCFTEENLEVERDET